MIDQRLSTLELEWPHPSTLSSGACSVASSVAEQMKTLGELNPAERRRQSMYLNAELEAMADKLQSELAQEKQEQQQQPQPQPQPQQEQQQSSFAYMQSFGKEEVLDDVEEVEEENLEDVEEEVEEETQVIEGHPEPAPAGRQPMGNTSTTRNRPEKGMLMKHLQTRQLLHEIEEIRARVLQWVAGIE
ncbi:hypothetical protein BGZ65_008627 [Modicella reniformis]|uniref:Uncharacterized protein n=1 Tax=Modicella reniformis TaxID=1440133 RepID=A0A9P6SUW1_9FUNG|nr:hypothetical protein BGZ65_008627 [Modicella reniformis]